MFEKNLVERIKVAMEKMKKDGIYGFGIEDMYLDEKVFGKRIRISEEYPNGEYDYEWIPPSGWDLGELYQDDRITYYVVRNQDEFHVLKLENNHPHCDLLVWSDLDSIPDFLLTELVESKKQV